MYKHYPIALDAVLSDDDNKHIVERPMFNDVTALPMTMQVFWGVTPCRLEDSYRRRFSPNRVLRS